MVMEYITDTSFIYLTLIGSAVALVYIYVKRKRVK
ncbi:EYxxD motif small membrane protein [Pseudalkalibacillus caeni]